MNEPDSWRDFHESAELTVSATLAAEATRLHQLFAAATLWDGLCALLVKSSQERPEPIFECRTDAFVSLHLAIHGYYKAAMSGLRSELDLALTSIWAKQHPDRAAGYFEGGAATPEWADLKSVLFLPRFRRYADQMHRAKRQDLVDQVRVGSVSSARNNVLSRTTHSAFGTWNFTDWLGNTPRYSAEAFDVWADWFELVQHMTLLWILLANQNLCRRVKGLSESGLFSVEELSFLASA